MGDPENWNSSSFDMDGNEYSGVVMSLMFPGVCVAISMCHVCSRRHVDRFLNMSVL